MLNLGFFARKVLRNLWITFPEMFFNMVGNMQ